MRAKNYRSIERPYTKKDYIAGAPQPKLMKFTYGQMSPSFDLIVRLVAGSDLQVRDVSLESARVTAGKSLSSRIGEKEFYLIVKAHPHHVLRENKMIFGAHADRLQEGMSRAFGTPIGRAAQITRGSTVIEVRSHSKNLQVVKEALATAAKKLPGTYRLEVDYNERTVTETPVSNAE
ncbi:MAG: 50S ribosomal protein L16 [Aigarchaeota archaeon]|nr:50S ribosomal protein L16 [Aigarchaeota archaeon]MDW8092668.1 50S ribosomal protein L16 [Nitrososphaerota archaeon]